MPEPVHIAAIDAGSNAVRLSVARAYSALDIEPLVNGALFAAPGRRRFYPPPLQRRTSQKRRQSLPPPSRNHGGVWRHANIAPSPPAPTREAQNRDTFVRRIKQATGIALEVISAKEESRLGREAVLAALGPEAPAALHRRSRRRQPGTQHPSRPQRCPRRATSRRHRAADDHAEYSRRDPPRASRTGPPLRSRAAGIAFARAAQSCRSKLPSRSAETRKLWRTSRPARVRTAFPLSKSLCCASASPTF